MSKVFDDMIHDIAEGRIREVPQEMVERMNKLAPFVARMLNEFEREHEVSRGEMVLILANLISSSPPDWRNLFQFFLSCFDETEEILARRAGEKERVLQ